MTRLSVSVLVVGLWSCSGSAAKVNKFDVEPRTACPGTNVNVTWDVAGKANLAVILRPNGSAEPEPAPDEITGVEKPVDSKGSDSVQVNETTWFVIRALDANQAKAPWLGKQHVDVPVKDEARGNGSTCADNVCTATFTIHADHASAQVLRIYDPTAKIGGKSRAAPLCVTHASLNHTCIDAGKSIDVTVPLEGDWTLETTFDGGPPTTPPGLSATFHIGCP